MFNNMFSKIVPIMKQYRKMLYRRSGYRQQYDSKELNAGYQTLEVHIE